MIWQIRIALLTSVVMASALCSVRAEDEKKADKKEPIAAPAAAPAPMPAPSACGGCAPAMKTICVTEWVPEYYKTTRTVMKQECVQEKYTAYKTECVPETKTRMVTHYEKVCETKDVCKTVCEKVCVQEERTCMKAVWTCCPVTTYTCKTVDKGHWECKEVCCEPNFFDRLKAKHSCGCESSCGSCGGCGDACNTCCTPVKTKTVKTWVSCKVTEQIPCTKMVKKCEMVPEKKCVTVTKLVPHTVTEKVTCWKCVPVCKAETYTCITHKCVPYEATRTVTKCVPVCEEVTCCKMVAKTVTKQVACAPACDTCNSCCETSCCKPSLHDRLQGLFAKHSCGCETGCSTCNSGCSTCH